VNWLSYILPFLKSFFIPREVNCRLEDREDFKVIEASWESYAAVLEKRIEKLERRVDTLVRELIRCQETHIEDRAEITALKIEVKELRER
jgi:hypothetical protein